MLDFWFIFRQNTVSKRLGLYLSWSVSRYGGICYIGFMENACKWFPDVGLFAPKPPKIPSLFNF